MSALDVLSAWPWLAGRLCRRGEVILVISTEHGLELLPAVSTDVDGLASPASWTYRATLTGPSHIPTLGTTSPRLTSFTSDGQLTRSNRGGALAPMVAASTNRAGRC